MVKALLDLFKNILDAIARIIASVLLMFWLWIPALYSVLFIAACIALGKSIVAVSNYFFAGLIVACLVSVVLILYSSSSAPKDKQRGTVGYRWQSKPATPDKDAPPEQPPATPPAQPQQQAMPPVIIQTPPVYVHTTPPVATPQPAERPMIFASRRDPTLLVCEYSDRLEFFRQSNGQVVYLSTEYKKK